MDFNFLNLDEKTRQYMIEEIKIAHESANLYFSKRFNEQGIEHWPDTLLEAASKYNEHWLAYQIEAEGFFREMEGAKKPTGGYTIKHVPQNASETLADGQFNRFYILGVCRRAIDDVISQVVIYRAKDRGEHRQESDSVVGSLIPPHELLLALRSNEMSLRHYLLRPNSGLSVHL